jgi:hypothetical protein
MSSGIAIMAGQHVCSKRDVRTKLINLYNKKPLWLKEQRQERKVVSAEEAETQQNWSTNIMNEANYHLIRNNPLNQYSLVIQSTLFQYSQVLGSTIIAHLASPARILLLSLGRVLLRGKLTA